MFIYLIDDFISLMILWIIKDVVYKCLSVLLENKIKIFYSSKSYINIKRTVLDFKKYTIPWDPGLQPKHIKAFITAAKQNLGLIQDRASLFFNMRKQALNKSQFWDGNQFWYNSGILFGKICLLVHIVLRTKIFVEVFATKNVFKIKNP